MKVVIPIGDLHIGGGCQVLVDVAHALMNRGHDVEIVMPKTGTVKYDVRCKLTIIPSLQKEYIPYGDIVLPNYYRLFPVAFEAWPKQCVRLSLGFEPLWVAQRDLALWTYKQNVPVISISHWLDEQIFSHVGKRTKVINLGIDESVFHPVGRKNISNNGQKVIFYIARPPHLGYQLKGFDDFKKAMEIVKQTYTDKFIVYMSCPEGPLTLPRIPYQVCTAKNEHDMAQLYRQADLFVSSSWYEAFCLPVLESMGCGTPVVTTNSGGILDFATHQQSAYITPPKDPKALAQGILQILTNQDLATRMAAEGLKSARRLTKAQFQKNIVDTLETIYEERRNKVSVLRAFFRKS